MLHLDAEVDPASELGVVDELDGFPVGPPPLGGVYLGRDVEAAVDGQGPVGPPVRLVRLQPLEELVGPGDDTFLAHPRHRPVDLQETHADIEAEAPVGGEGDDTGVDEELIVALVEESDVLLDLRSDVPQWFIGGEGVGGVTVTEVLLDAKDVVAPQPFVWSGRAQVHLVGGVGGVEFAHEGEHRVPRGGHHVREDRVAGRIGGEDRRTLIEFGSVLGVDVDDCGAPTARRAS